MTPAEHYAWAENILLCVKDGPDAVADSTVLAAALLSISHGLLAVAGELGVPTSLPSIAHLPPPSPPSPAQDAPWQQDASQPGGTP